MDIGEAVAFLYNGDRVYREAWKDDNPYTPTFLYLVQGSVFNVNRKPLLGIFERGEEIRYRSHIDAMKILPNKELVAWYYEFHQEDITARDWEVYNSNKEEQPCLL